MTEPAEGKLFAGLAAEFSTGLFPSQLLRGAVAVGHEIASLGLHIKPVRVTVTAAKRKF
jgi:hypothetical protein